MVAPISRRPEGDGLPTWLRIQADADSDDAEVLCVEISWDRECAELVADERNALHERLETANDGHVPALEAVDPELTATLNPGAEAAHDHGRNGGMREAPERTPGEDPRAA